MCFGGASSSENAINQQQQQMLTTLSQNYATQFANQSAILSSLNSTFGNILAAGPGQFGYTPAETAALRTQSDTGTANAYQSARQAVGEQAASIGGGNMALGSGTLQGINANLAQQAASQQSNQQLGITEAGYAQGLQNFNNAAGVLGGVAQQYNPLGYANSSISQGGEAFGSASAINQQNLAGQQALWGTIGGALSGGLGQGLSFAGGQSSGGSYGGGGYGADFPSSGPGSSWDNPDYGIQSSSGGGGGAASVLGGLEGLSEFIL